MSGVTRSAAVPRVAEVRRCDENGSGVEARVRDVAAACDWKSLVCSYRVSRAHPWQIEDQDAEPRVEWR